MEFPKDTSMDFSLGQLLRIGIQIVILIPAGGAILGALIDISSPLLFLLAIIVTYAVTFWTAIAIHELGHAAAAKLTGQRISVIAIWPIDYDVKSRTFRLSRGQQTGDIGGFVSLKPDQWPTYRQYILFIVGGIAASLLASAFLLTVVNVWGFTDAIRGISLILTALAFISLGVALGNAVPFRQSSEGIHADQTFHDIISDGARLLDAIRSRRSRQWRRWV